MVRSGTQSACPGLDGRKSLIRLPKPIQERGVMPRIEQDGAGRSVPRLRSPLLLLAAGRGSRLGFPKALVEVDGRPWVEQQLMRFAEAGGRHACVVLGHALEAHRQALPWLEEAMRGAIPECGLMVQVAVNPRPERGMRSSLDVGLDALGLRSPGSASTCFVMPIDCTARVFEELETLSAETLVPSCEGRSGHPVRLGAAALAALARDEAPLDRVLGACAGATATGRRRRGALESQPPRRLGTPLRCAAHALRTRLSGFSSAQPGHAPPPTHRRRWRPPRPRAPDDRGRAP